MPTQPFALDCSTPTRTQTGHRAPCIKGAGFGLTTGWAPRVRRRPVRRFWYANQGDGSDGRGRGLKRATRVSDATAVHATGAIYLIPTLQENSACARFHRSCSRLVTLAR